MSRTVKLLALTCACLPTAALLLSTTPAHAATLGTGDLVVYRVGDGSAALGSTATAVFLDEFSAAGLVQTIPLPTTGSGNQRRLTASGSATSEGLISRTQDGTAVLATGYDATLGTTGVASTTSAATNRVVGRLTSDGLVDTSTALTDAPSANNVRSASGLSSALPSGSAAGSSVTVAGGAGNLRGTTLGSAGTSSQLNTDLANIRQVETFAGQTFVSTGSGTTVRLGQLNTSSSTITPLPGLPVSAGSPYSFALLDLTSASYNGTGLDTLYVADDSATGGGILKYSFDGTNFVAKGVVTDASARGLAARVVGNDVQLAVTNGTSLQTLTDTSAATSTLTGTPATIATAPTNEAYRGVALAPVALAAPPVSLPELKTAALLPVAGVGVLFLATRLRRRRTV